MRLAMSTTAVTSTTAMESAAHATAVGSTTHSAAMESTAHAAAVEPTTTVVITTFMVIIIETITEAEYPEESWIVVARIIVITRIVVTRIVITIWLVAVIAQIPIVIIVRVAIRVIVC